MKYLHAFSPQFIKFARLIRQERATAIGQWFLLEAYCFQHAEDGVLKDLEAKDVEKLVEWDGVGDRWVEAALECELLVRSHTGELCLANWPDEAPKSVRDRLYRRNRRKSEREDRQVSSTGRRHVAAMSPLNRNRNGNGNTHTPVRSTSNRTGESEDFHLESEAAETKPQKKPTADQIAEIYNAYPRKRQAARAKHAIEKALRIIEKREHIDDAVGWLLGRTKLFARSDAGQRGQYTPHPATWYNGGGYDDDENEWRDNGHSPTTTAPETLKFKTHERRA